MAVILLVGSDRDWATGIRRLLREDGHRVAWERSVEEWRSHERETRPDLIVATVDSLDGVLATPARPVRGFPAPLLWVQQEAAISPDPYLEERLVDHISSPFLREELLGRVDALVRTRRVLMRQPDGGPRPVPGGGRQRLRQLGGRLAALLGSRVPKCEKPLAPYLEVAARIADWADRRDAFEPGHAERVTSSCAMISDILALPAEEGSALLRSAMLHDIGKVALPAEMLRQREPLAEGQRRLIRTHPRRGAALVRALDPDDVVADTILLHHERPDGSGYYGRSPEQVPRTARVLAVAEVFEGLTHSRLRPRFGRDEALDHLLLQRGSGLDAECVDALVHGLRRKRATIPLQS